MFAGVLRRPKLPLNCRGVVHQRTPEHMCEPHFHSWGSSGRRFESCQPDQYSRRSKPYRRPAPEGKAVPGGGMYSNRYGNPRSEWRCHNPSLSARPSTADLAVSSLVCPYTSPVIAMELCPSRSATALICTPIDTMSAAIGSGRRANDQKRHAQADRDLRAVTPRCLHRHRARKAANLAAAQSADRRNRSRRARATTLRRLTF